MTATSDHGTYAGQDTSLTNEGGQEMDARGAGGAAELLRELGATLRMSETEAAALAGNEDSADDSTMIINMGPQQRSAPDSSSHGVTSEPLSLIHI